jgi:predicted Zn finger-like uncharacterized protein
LQANHKERTTLHDPPILVLLIPIRERTMSRPWTCPVCQTVIILGDPQPGGKVRCPTCGTDFAYPAPVETPRRRESSGGGEDSDAHTPTDED